MGIYLLHHEKSIRVFTIEVTDRKFTIFALFQDLLSAQRNLFFKEEIEMCCRGLADYKRVRSFSIREEEFPKTTTRKIKRFLFKEGTIQTEK